MPEKLNHTEEMLDPRVFDHYHRTKNQNWLFTVEIKSFFHEPTTIEGMEKLCRQAMAEMKRVQKAVDGMTVSIDADEREYYHNNLEELHDGFEWVLEAGGTEDEMQENFNYILDDLYNLGDTKMVLKDNTLRKFLWVN